MRPRSFLLNLVAGALVALLAAPALAEKPAQRPKNYNATTRDAGFAFAGQGVIPKVLNASIARDGTITARFSITDSRGRPLDINGVLTPGPVTVRFVAAYIPAGRTQYVAYTTSVLNSVTNSNPSQRVAGTDTGGTVKLIDAEKGLYDYTFGTKAPATFDPAVTHSIGMQAERDLSEVGITEVTGNDHVFHFVPNGSPVTVVRDIVSEKSCNNCHDPISAHGVARKSMAYCVMCHTPQSVNPDTLNTADMGVFVHKLHMGKNLPSVKEGKPYFMIHRNQRVDFSEISFPQDIRNCGVCHEPGPKQADNWKTNPSQALCTSCHDNVNTTTGQNHPIPVANDTLCKNCHTSIATSEYDGTIPGSHIPPAMSSALPGMVFEFIRLANATPGSAPTVTFKVTDKIGNPLDITKLTTVRVLLAGPNQDYQTGPGAIRVSENPVATATGSNGVYTYTMTAKVPDAAKGSYTISLEGRNTVTLLAGTTKQRTATDMAKPIQLYFPVDGTSVEARRVVVDNAKCATCHANLGFIHGGSRTNTQECAICHNPSLVNNTQGQPLSFATMAHAIHRGEALANPYVIGTTNFQEVLYPGDLRNCNACHVNNSHLPENVGAKANVSTPGRFVRSTPPITAACIGCHDTRSTAAHAAANTNEIGESCATCHSGASQFSVTAVHAKP
ncbi:MAG: OmcA/MtrC family decaheme c-type cytochrome [Bryobacterales bacterium]|nr:OmcA/MtrC family decaheme c-type cytochrome [Bryobacterales bacterium]